MDRLVLTIGHDEALVLYAWLSSLEEKSNSAVCDDAEQTVLWRIEGQLEKMLVEVFAKDYKEQVAAAKDRI